MLPLLLRGVQAVVVVGHAEETARRTAPEHFGELGLAGARGGDGGQEEGDEHRLRRASDGKQLAPH